MLYAIAIILSYFVGSIPVGLLITRAFGRGDLRQVGSGNIGAANVMRVGGLRMAGLVWLLDMAKAMIAVWGGRWIGGDVFGVLCGFIAIVGYCYPVWLRFHGGKGVSCFFGLMLAVNPLIFVICGVEWLIVALGLGYSSAGALAICVVAPICGFVLNPLIGVIMLAVALLVVWRHRENIGRLVGGTESKIGWKWKK